jgi:hypothetical protein
MKQIKMLTIGPNKNYQVGQVLEVDNKRAKKLIQMKQAVLVK